jgi:hypothetical protein
MIEMTKDENHSSQDGAKPSGAMSEDEIDRNLRETFPASDPPSWTLGTNHREETRSKEDEPQGDPKAK